MDKYQRRTAIIRVLKQLDPDARLSPNELARKARCNGLSPGYPLREILVAVSIYIQDKRYNERADHERQVLAPRRARAIEDDRRARANAAFRADWS